MMAAAGEDEAGFLSLTEKIARERRFACGSYKDKCLRRRIAVRMRACRASTYASYAAYLDEHPPEWERLLDALTINVTKFFRNPDVYQAVAEQLIPDMWSSPAPVLRIWSAGCASGEETYTLAILCHRHAERVRDAAGLARVNILGTDIDARSLAAAKDGRYAETAFTETPADVRAEYFSREAPFELRADVRALARFERRDLLNDAAPPGPFHLVACRNVMIYFDRASQDQLIDRFHAVLIPGGFLLLGKTETLLGAVRDRFTLVRQRERIFRRT